MWHILEAFPKVPGPGEEETLHKRALQDLLFVRPLASKTGNGARG